MKIYINREAVVGPWGGGNKFLTSLIHALCIDHEVTHRLSNDIDVILCMDPRQASWGETINEILNHKGRARLICRLGDVGTHNKPQLTQLWKDNIDKFDVIISPSQWAIDYLKLTSSVISRSHVIHNAPFNIFHEAKSFNTNCDGNIVTHHWSDNELKGFSLYNELQNLRTFTYIGRKPQRYTFQNFIGILDTKDLSFELSKHSIYLTASKFEAGANHVLEAMACGLPVIYSNQGGSIVEYCKDFGIQYDEWNIKSCIDAIEHCVCEYEHYKRKVLCYTATVEDTVKSYVKLISELQ